MFDLMIGIDSVQRSTRRAFPRRSAAPARAKVGSVRVYAAAALRALADRIEPAPRAANYAVGGEM
jgi:hypothetical protein